MFKIDRLFFSTIISFYVPSFVFTALVTMTQTSRLAEGGEGIAISPLLRAFFALVKLNIIKTAHIFSLMSEIENSEESVDTPSPRILICSRYRRVNDDKCNDLRYSVILVLILDLTSGLISFLLALATNSRKNPSNSVPSM